MIRKAKGFLIKRVNFRETSVIVTFFTQECGKIKGIIKGVRKDPGKIGSNLNLCSYNDIVFYEKRNTDLNLISQCDLIKDYSFIRKDMRMVALASYIAELADTVMPIAETNTHVFQLMQNCLDSLETLDIEKILYCFQVKILSLSGFKPHLDACIHCSKKLHGAAYFSISLGGLLCPHCRDRDEYSNSILKGTVNSLIHLEACSWHKALTMGLHKTIRLELRSILYNFLSFHLDKEMKSFRFLYNPA
ncbi:DNA repair protein RecO [Candidatus Omnitrophota bacterium]